MSYILEALKKADEARGAAPRAVSMPRALPPVARPRWPWIAAGLGALAVVAAVAALWVFAPATDPAPSRANAGGSPTSPVAPAPAALAATPTVPVTPAPVATSPVAADSVATAATAPAASVAPAPAMARDAAAPAPPADVSRRPEPMPAAPSAVTRSTGVERPANARAAVVTPAQPPKASSPPPAQIARSVSPPERPVSAAAPPAAAARPPAAGGAPAPGPTRPRSETTPTASGPAGDLRAMVSKLSLQVLSWSADPKDRFVFVNGRKYVEGQAIDDKLVIERITDGGVVLTYQGERTTLRSP